MKACEYCDCLAKYDSVKCASCGAPFKRIKDVLPLAVQNAIALQTRGENRKLGQIGTLTPMPGMQGIHRIR